MLYYDIELTVSCVMTLRRREDDKKKKIMSNNLTPTEK